MGRFFLSIIIPVFNEKDTILETLRRIENVCLTKLGFKREIIIVDDCSTDGTRAILKSLENKYKIIYHSKNQGKESAIKSALAVLSPNSDYIIIQDADLEYNPQDYKKIIQSVLEKDALVVYGSRWLNPKNCHPYKIFYWGGIFLTFLTNFFYRQKITDVLTGLKLFKSEILKNINLEYKRFEFCCEITAKISKKGIKIYEVPIDYSPRGIKDFKKIKINDGLKMIFVMFRYLFY